MSPTSLPIERGAWRWQQRSSSATALPSMVRKSTTGSSRMIRRSMLRPTSWSQAATYHALRTNMTDPPDRSLEQDSLDDSVGPLQHNGRNGQPERLCRGQIDHEFEPRSLLDGEI